MIYLIDDLQEKLSFIILRNLCKKSYNLINLTTRSNLK